MGIEDCCDCSMHSAPAEKNPSQQATREWRASGEGSPKKSQMGIIFFRGPRGGFRGGFPSSHKKGSLKHIFSQLTPLD